MLGCSQNYQYQQRTKLVTQAPPYPLVGVSHETSFSGQIAPHGLLTPLMLMLGPILPLSAATDMLSRNDCR